MKLPGADAQAAMEMLEEDEAELVELEELLTLLEELERELTELEDIDELTLE